MKIPLLAVFLGILSLPSFSQNNHQLGARSAAMGNASVGVSDLWSVHHNQAGLARLDKIEAGIYYENRFLVPELSVKAIALAMPIKNGVFGLSVSHFGFALYSESKVGLAFAQKLGEKVSAGVQLDYLNTFIAEGYGNKGMLTGEVGVQAELVPGLTLGAHVFNPFRVKLASHNNERIPTIMRLGLSYEVSKKVLFCVETLKDTQHKPVFRAGLEYNVIEQFYLRGGISTNPGINTFGFGLKLNQFKIDFATSIHSVLGYSPMVSLSYAF
ncbi:MAG: hypothetical protein H0V01_05055 [Bacteroidetes bacterium]|nr:hypothetical protein [Bacteroidota bacterium]HET6245748.1 hypothetical protein [Bacteroidia bacterium]